MSRDAMDHKTSECTCEGKYCPDCKQVKCCGAFNRNKTTGDGLYVYCRVCHRARGAAAYAQRRAPSESELAFKDNPVIIHVDDSCACPGKYCPDCKSIKCHG